MDERNGVNDNSNYNEEVKIKGKNKGKRRKYKKENSNNNSAESIYDSTHSSTKLTTNIKNEDNAINIGVLLEKTVSGKKTFPYGSHVPDVPVLSNIDKLRDMVIDPCDVSTSGRTLGKKRLVEEHNDKKMSVLAIPMSNTRQSIDAIKTVRRTVSNTAYEKGGRVIAKNQIVGSHSRGPKEKFTSNIYFVFRGIPMSHRLSRENIFVTVNPFNAFERMRSAPGFEFILELLKTMYDYVRIHKLGRINMEKHVHSSDSVVRYLKGAVCDGCSCAMMLSQEMRTALFGRNLYVVDEFKCTFPTGKASTVCTGLIVYILSYGLEEEVNVNEISDLQTYVPNFMASNIMYHTLTERLNGHVMNTAGSFCSVYGIASDKQLNILLMLGFMADIWKMMCLNVSKIRYSGGQLLIPKVLGDRVKDVDRWHYSHFLISEDACSVYSTRGTFQMIPVLRLYINNHVVSEMNGIYGYLANKLGGIYSYMIKLMHDSKKYYSESMDDTVIDYVNMDKKIREGLQLCKQFSKSSKAQNFLNEASIKTFGTNDGITFVIPVRSHDSGIPKIFDKFYSFLNQHKMTDTVCVTVLFQPKVFELLTQFAKEFYENNFCTVDEIQCTWCFEYYNSIQVYDMPLIKTKRALPQEAFEYTAVKRVSGSESTDWSVICDEEFAKQELINSQKTVLVKTEGIYEEIKIIQKICDDKAILNKLDYVMEVILMDQKMECDKNAWGYNSRQSNNKIKSDINSVDHFPALGSDVSCGNKKK